MLLILGMMVIIAITSCFMKHPLTLGMILLSQTILTALVTGFLNVNFWFSYIIFLIMVGGMLILFTYMTSIASNEKFKFSFKIMMFLMMAALTLMMINFIIDPMFLSIKISMEETLMIQENPPSMFLNKFINYPHNMIYSLMIIYLLITLIAIVKIPSKQKGTLRQMF